MPDPGGGGVAIGAARSEYEHVAAAHIQHYARLAAHVGPRLRGAGQPDGGAAQLAALHCWEVELGNLSAALEAAVRAGETVAVLAIARWLLCYLEITGAYGQLRAVYSALLDTADAGDDGQLAVQALLALGRAESRLGNYHAARAAWQRLLPLAAQLGCQAEAAAALGDLGRVEYWQDDRAAARTAFEQSLALHRELDLPGGAALALNNLAMLDTNPHDTAQGGPLLTQALELARQQGDVVLEATILNNLAMDALRYESCARTGSYFAQAAALSTALGHRQGQVMALGNLALVKVGEGSYAEARVLLVQVTALCREIGDTYTNGVANLSLALCDAHEGHTTWAAQRIAGVLQTARRMEVPHGVVVCCVQAAAVLAASSDFGAAATCLHGSYAQAVRIQYPLTVVHQQELQTARAGLAAALAAGRVAPADLAQWEADGTGLDLAGLADFTQRALEDAAAASLGSG